MMEDEWRAGVEEIIGGLWEIVDNESDAQGESSATMLIATRLPNEDEDALALEDLDAEEDEDEAALSTTASSPFDLNEAMDPYFSTAPRYEGNEFRERGAEMGLRWISRNPFAKFLRRLGKIKASLIRNLRIVSSDDRDLPPHGQVYDVLLQCLSFMSAIIATHLPGVRTLELEKEHRWTYPGLNDELCNGSCAWLYEKADVLETFLERQVSWDRWIEEERHDLFGAVKMLVVGTRGLKELRLRNWHYCEGLPVPDNWWGRWEYFGKKGVRTVLERRFVCPGWEKVLIFDKDIDEERKEKAK
jgi:hypothetical protein